MEALPDFRLHRPTTVDDALATAKAEPGARLLAGGTDLIVNMRRGIVETPALIDLTGVAEMQGIARDGETLTIGGAVTMDTLSQNCDVAQDFSAITQAAAEVAGSTHRNECRATFKVPMVDMNTGGNSVAENNRKNDDVHKVDSPVGERH